MSTVREQDLTQYVMFWLDKDDSVEKSIFINPGLSEPQIIGQFDNNHLPSMGGCIILKRVEWPDKYPGEPRISKLRSKRMGTRNPNYATGQVVSIISIVAYSEADND